LKAKQSLAGAIRERLDSIEQQLEIGIRQEAILEQLAEVGHITTLSNFRNELYRARKRREKNSKKVPVRGTKAIEPQVKKPETTTSFAFQGTPKDADDLI
jgi:hypothetical protein